MDDTLRKGDKRTEGLSYLPFPSPAGVQNSIVLNNTEQPLSLADDRDTGLADAERWEFSTEACVSQLHDDERASVRSFALCSTQLDTFPTSYESAWKLS